MLSGLQKLRADLTHVTVRVAMQEFKELERDFADSSTAITICFVQSDFATANYVEQLPYRLQLCMCPITPVVSSQPRPVSFFSRAQGAFGSASRNTGS